MEFALIPHMDTRWAHPPSLLSNGTRGSFYDGKVTGAGKLTIHNLVLRLRMCELYLHSPHLFSWHGQSKYREGYVITAGSGDVRQNE
jgi:hypothetical protein